MECVECWCRQKCVCRWLLIVGIVAWLFFFVTFAMRELNAIRVMTSCHSMVMVMTRAEINFSINFPDRHIHYRSNFIQMDTIRLIFKNANAYVEGSAFEISSHNVFACQFIGIFMLPDSCTSHLTETRIICRLNILRCFMSAMCVRQKYIFLHFFSLFPIAADIVIVVGVVVRCCCCLPEPKKAISLIQHRLDECVTSASCHYLTHRTHSIFFLFSSLPLFVSVLNFLFAFVRLWHFFRYFLLWF